MGELKFLGREYFFGTFLVRGCAPFAQQLGVADCNSLGSVEGSLVAQPEDVEAIRIVLDKLSTSARRLTPDLRLHDWIVERLELTERAGDIRRRRGEFRLPLPM